MFTTFNDTFKDILLDINNNGELSQPRDMQVKELTVKTLEFNPNDTIADFNSRSFNFKYFAGELAWYLMKDRDVDYISKFSGFWKHITNPGTNEINSNYGSLLFNEQLAWVVKSLKADKNSRQAIAFLNQPKYQFDGNKDFVCTMYLNFFIRNNKLNMKVQMRSNDVYYGLTFDAPFFSFVYQHVLHELQKTYILGTGTYYHCADNIHFYDRHFDLTDKILAEPRGVDTGYEMCLKRPMFKIKENDCELTQDGLTYIKELNQLAKNKEATQEDYKLLLKNYVIA